MAIEYDNEDMDSLEIRLNELERRIEDIERTLGSDNLRYLDEQLKLRGF